VFREHQNFKEHPMSTNEKGTTVNPTEHNGKTSSPKTGLVAMLRGLLRVKGSGAPKIGLGLVVSVLVMLFGALGFAAAPALAAAPETPETGEASAVMAATATLKGVLNPKATGEPEEYEFLYGRRGAECKGGSTQ
jgi:hypothetical protein